MTINQTEVRGGAVCESMETAAVWSARNTRCVCMCVFLCKCDRDRAQAR